MPHVTIFIQIKGKAGKLERSRFAHFLLIFNDDFFSTKRTIPLAFLIFLLEVSEYWNLDEFILGNFIENF